MAVFGRVRTIAGVANGPAAIGDTAGRAVPWSSPAAVGTGARAAGDTGGCGGARGCSVGCGGARGSSVSVGDTGTSSGAAVTVAVALLASGRSDTDDEDASLHEMGMRHKATSRKARLSLCLAPFTSNHC